MSCYYFAWGEEQTPLSCQWIQLVGHSLQCSRCHSLTSSCNVNFQIICKEWFMYSISQSSWYTIDCTRKRVTTLPVEFQNLSVCLFCEMYPLTLTLIHLSPISSLMNYIIFPSIPMFSSCYSVFSLLNLSYAFSISKKIIAVFFFFLNPSRIFVVIFDIASIVLPCFLKSNCLSTIFLLPFQVPHQSLVWILCFSFRLHWEHSTKQYHVWFPHGAFMHLLSYNDHMLKIYI